MPPGPTGKPEPRRKVLPDHTKMPHNDPLRIVIQGIMVKHPTLGIPTIRLQYVDGPFEDPTLCHGLLALATEIVQNQSAAISAAVISQKKSAADSIAIPTEEQLQQTIEGVVSSALPAPQG